LYVHAVKPGSNPRFTLACEAENSNSLIGLAGSEKIFGAENPENPAANNVPSVVFKKVLLSTSTFISPYFDFRGYRKGLNKMSEKGRTATFPFLTSLSGLMDDQ
jgi:hypothetical protein